MAQMRKGIKTEIAEIIAGAILGAALTIGLVIFSLHTLQALQARVPLDYGEGPLLNQARLIAEGRSIYRSDLTDYPYTIANYPPLYPLAVSLVGRLAGFSYATGRFVSALATLGCGLALGFIALRMTGDRMAATVSGALFLSFPYVIYWGSLGRVDPLALALSLWGIWAALRWPDSPAGLGLSLLLLLAAVYTRQSYLLAAPLAVTVHLGIHHWRRALGFILVLGFATLLAGGILTWRTDGGFFFHTIVANANTFVPSRALFTWLNALFLALPLLSLVLWEFLHYARRREKTPWLAVAYLAGSTLSGITVGKVGSNVNYLLEWVAAMAMLGGVALARWRREVPPVTRFLLLLILALQVPWSPYSGQVFIIQCTLRRTAEPEVRQLEAMVCPAPGPVLADEMMSLLVVCGREILLQPYELTLLAAEGKWDPSPVVNDMTEGKFAFILITGHPPFREEPAGDRWTPQMWAAIRERYEPVTILAGTTVYRPRAYPDGEHR